jgi:hypothetical protein
VQASNISKHCNFLGCYPQGSVVKFVDETWPNSPSLLGNLAKIK